MGKRRRLKKFKAVDPFSAGTSLKKVNIQDKHVEKHQLVPHSFSAMVKMKKIANCGSNREIKKRIREEMTYEDNYTYETKKRKKEAERKKGESHFKHMLRLSAKVNDAIMQAKESTQEEPEKKIVKEAKKKSKVKVRLQHLKDKRRSKLTQRKIDEQEKQRWTDHVKFGEVVMAPPDLKIKPRKALEMSKPGKRDLLLKKHFQGKTKSSNLSMARMKVLDDERQRVIGAYREMKNRKTSSNV